MAVNHSKSNELARRFELLKPLLCLFCQRIILLHSFFTFFQFLIATNNVFAFTMSIIGRAAMILCSSWNNSLTSSPALSGNRAVTLKKVLPIYISELQCTTGELNRKFHFSVNGVPNHDLEIHVDDRIIANWTVPRHVQGNCKNISSPKEVIQSSRSELRSFSGTPVNRRAFNIGNLAPGRSQIVTFDAVCRPLPHLSTQPALCWSSSANRPLHNYYEGQFDC